MNECFLIEYDSTEWVQLVKYVRGLLLDPRAILAIVRAPVPGAVEMPARRATHFSADLRAFVIPG